ncbi:chemotaxis protein CheW [Pseudomonas sp. ZM23]|uniref:Chemotaxis protein CheW n=1 Tax=Pseudomonas triclosanedens TaxID=2961893 RepID=A0ABY6ZUC2_9PSED|nr:chemotaxis protein CheW [Pseudomonas triclosanedens]MCP8463477.1 chemotaxis protein CheW [Pseudomonas triclosanedens]MCP8469464.1 chemotaxis protein CheW [Pseudomonas triclosanedens]MCP8474278.1 chemotaxis protein CheW [Pseudomonas triclosanedens]WAI48335.1 chemotaxis protein CheW [Pseudomonas triclosanedens]
MPERGYELELDSRAEPVDDCWNRIGVRGDKSCAQLSEHIHCRNCPVYAAAAIRLLDRYSLGDESPVLAPAAEDAAPETGHAHLIFRLGDEWLGLPTRALAEVASECAVHSLPHQRSPALLGVANVRGTLVACVSLGELLGLDRRVAAGEGARVVPRMLILAAPGGPVLSPVDEVDGIHALDAAAMIASSGQSLAATDRFTHGVVQWSGRSVRLLDHEALLDAATRSLA